MMKAPKYVALSMPAMDKIGVNPFAAQLVAESFADKPERFGGETAIVCARAHNGTHVYMLISTQLPEPEQFKDWPQPAGDATVDE